MSHSAQHFEPTWPGLDGALNDELPVRLEAIASTLRRLSELAARQRNLLEADDPQPLLDLLAKRQEEVDRLADPVRGIVSVSQAIGEIRRRRAGGGVVDGAPVTDEVAALVDEIESSLAGIIESDLTDQARLEARLREIEGELATNRSAQAAATAYAAHSGARITSMDAPRFTDRKG